MSDGLAAVARELAALGGADRRAILHAFDAADRKRIGAAMRTHAGRAAALKAGPAALLHAEWFEALLVAAQAPGDRRMTAATRTALLQATEQTRASVAAPPGRSLFQAAGGLLHQAVTR